MCILLPLLVINRSEAATPKKVLLFNSYHQGYEWTDDMVSGVRAAMAQGLLNAELHVEYMDSRRHSAEEYHENLVRFYQNKFSGLQFDAVIAGDDTGVKFLFDHRNQLFSKAPLIFCGVNEYKGTSKYVTAGNVRRFATGVLERVDVEDTASLALRLHPDTKHIYLIADGFAPSYELDLKKQYPEIDVRRIHAQRLTMAEIEQQVSQAPANSFVLLSAFSHDAAGRQFTMRETAQIISDRSPVPVYGVNRNTLGFGIVGGKLNDGYAQGYEAAKVAEVILRGTAPADIPIQDEGANPYMFDYRQLERWGISEAALPAGSTIIARPWSFYEGSKALVWGFAAFMIGQAVVISLLVASRIKRKRFERALERSEQNLARQVRDFETLLKVIPVGIGVAEDPECNVVRTNRAFAELLGLDLLENASKTRTDAEDLPFRIFRDGEEIPNNELPMQVAAREGRDVLDFELDVVRADGKVVHEFGSATPLFDEQGKVRGSIGVFVDITERKRAEEALRESEHRFRQLADSMPQIVWTARPDGYLDYYNRRWYETTGSSDRDGGDE
ncbi:MAG: ABC transporter substrate binding protein, partial [Bryobacteraceae bacterium]